MSGWAPIGLALWALACAEDAGDGDGGTADGGTDSDVGIDASTSDAAGDPDAGPALIRVSHPRELRGAWVATVSNINFPSRAGLSATALQAELQSLVDLLAGLGFNAIFFQVRPESDAFYPSTLEPWSRYLSGTQGGDPGFDPLAYLLEIAHAQHLEVHAWLNPYRAKASQSSRAVAPHLSLTLSQYAYVYGSALWMDPGAPPVRDHLLAVIDDLLSRYALDGLHFDDYFYPYPIANTPFPDDGTFAAYQAAGGTLGRADWRRDNVNQMVEAVHDLVVTRRPDTRFGVAPFGIYRPGMPAGITGLDQYAEIYADPVRWMEEGWVDYLAPQLYWPSSQTRQAYEPLLGWWSALTAEGRSVFAGNYLSQLGSSAAWTVDEFRTQIELSRQARAQGSRGNIFYSVAPLLEDRNAIQDLFRALYARPALPPPIGALAGRLVSPPTVEATPRGIRLGAPAPGGIRGFLVYQGQGVDAQLQGRYRPEAQEITLSPGNYAISAVDWADVESEAVPHQQR